MDDKFSYDDAEVLLRSLTNKSIAKSLCEEIKEALSSITDFHTQKEYTKALYTLISHIDYETTRCRQMKEFHRFYLPIDVSDEIYWIRQEIKKISERYLLPTEKRTNSRLRYLSHELARLHLIQHYYHYSSIPRTHHSYPSVGSGDYEDIE